ncbi:hypothetical protein AAFF_G00122500 [Aldrovandia affinis]|uniref:Mutator-like transposase domain-containing protein n=1 Tax=Aldrovandia affinis TaxID=143900 RepID=A0AAD7RS46_9TELE|nr:hypothetical protein AAFF_G00122500 [Aldrovandia affinis]
MWQSSCRRIRTLSSTSLYHSTEPGRRGGIGICIDIFTGLVIDYEVLSTYCHACVLKATAVKEKKVTEEDYKTWKEEHTDCAQNFAGSSKAMEQESAKRMWGRSVNLHQLRYTQMLGDGDSSALREVVSLDPYPGLVVEKLECINHAHKRMGTALRKLSSEGKLGGKGVGKLTAKKCKALQNFYRGAIVTNQGSVEAMKAAIWAGLLHSMSSDENPMHTRCNVSWCWFRKAEDNGEEPDSHSQHPQNFLSKEVGRKLLPVYHRMTSDALLQRMQHGGTQNTNECLNSVIWARCPKTVFVGKSRIEAAAGMAVATFNEGAHAMLGVMEKLWLGSTMVTLENMRGVDLLPVTKAEAVTSAVARCRRKHLSTAQKLKRHQQELNEGQLYGAGMAE